MKRSILVPLAVLGLILSIGPLGCKHGTVGLTPIPGQQSAIAGPGAAPAVTTTPPAPVSSGPAVAPQAQPSTEKLPPGKENIPPLYDLGEFEGRPTDREVFKSYTVYFDFDRSEVKPTEQYKIKAVGDYLKLTRPDCDLLVEGNCDERGTEEYNRALGERRALAIRESLLNLGIEAKRIRTISYGKDRPVDPGHNEEAWAKNRRGDFVLLLPKALAK
ncbi:MAG: OmpA family protein [Candidatus Omnitrophica bacterium]|nr:OmpA family protein [Candidatus Omnitrophota bacterium]